MSDFDFQHFSWDEQESRDNSLQPPTLFNQRRPSSSLQYRSEFEPILEEDELEESHELSPAPVGASSTSWRLPKNPNVNPRPPQEEIDEALLELLAEHDAEAAELQNTGNLGQVIACVSNIGG
jgi:hypothetical protein